MVNLFYCALTLAANGNRLRVANPHATPCVVAVEISSPGGSNARKSADPAERSPLSKGGRSRYNRSSAARFAQALMRHVASGSSRIRDLQTTRWQSREGEPVIGGQGMLTVCTGSPGK